MNKAEIKAAIEAAARKHGVSASVAFNVVNDALASKIGPVFASPDDIFGKLMGDAGFQTLADASARVPVNIGPFKLGMSVRAGERMAPRTKATMTTGDFPKERTYLPLVAGAARKLHMRDVFPIAGLSTPQLEYARLIGCDNSAGGVAEGAQKPESGVDTELKTEAVKQIATWLPYSRQAARDVTGFAAFLSNLLQELLLNEEDDQILNGAGGNDLNGILNDPDIQLQTFSTNIIDTVRKGITKVQTGDQCLGGGWEPTAIVMHPTNWESVEISKYAADGHYVMIPEGTSPADGVPAQRLWRIPVVVTPAIALNTGLLGAFDVGATLWTYDDAVLRISDSHSDFFVKNLVAALIESRELLSTYIPRAFVKLTLA